MALFMLGFSKQKEICLLISFFSSLSYARVSRRFPDALGSQRPSALFRLSFARGYTQMASYDLVAMSSNPEVDIGH